MVDFYRRGKVKDVTGTRTETLLYIKFLKLIFVTQLERYDH